MSRSGKRKFAHRAIDLAAANPDLPNGPASGTAETLPGFAAAPMPMLPDASHGASPRNGGGGGHSNGKLMLGSSGLPIRSCAVSAAHSPVALGLWGGAA